METINKLEILKENKVKMVQKISPEYMKIYSNTEAVKAAVDYFKGDELAGTVWVNKYALKDSKGNIFEKTP